MTPKLPSVGSVRDIENLITQYIDDAARFARGEPLIRTSCYLSGIRTPEQLSTAIKQLGGMYVEKMKALAKAAPIVRGNTISIYEPRDISPNTPSKEDEKFLSECLCHLKKHGFVLAADADTYEKIAAAYPGRVHPERVRGAEAKRWLAMQRPDYIVKAANKTFKKGGFYK